MVILIQLKIKLTIATILLDENKTMLLTYKQLVGYLIRRHVKLNNYNKSRLHHVINIFS